MASKIKAFARYLFLLMVTGFLLWLSLRQIQVEEGETRWSFILHVWEKAHGGLLLLSGLVAILSHLIRAIRWRLLLHPLGYPTTLSASFLSVMVGYFVNLAIPRGGEISRCYNLYKLQSTPVNESFGTVVAERVIDLGFLLTLIGVAFTLQWSNLMQVFAAAKPQVVTENPNSYLLPLGIATGIGLITLFAAVWIFRTQHPKIILFRSKITTFLLGLKSGLLVVFKLRQKGLFALYSLAIWVLYFLMSYTVLLAFPETAGLGLSAALSVFVIGGIAMAVPLPGGAGSYHVLVPLGLVLLYNIREDQAVAFTVIFHGWQTLLLILFGVVSLFLSQTKFQIKHAAD
jgi:glycosyltransferase 2 family protein